MEPTYDLTKYPLVQSEWMQMDDRHIYMLHEAAKLPWKGTRVAVEIGPWKGRTTTALIEAINLGKLDHLHIIETTPTPELYQVIACATDPSKVTLHNVPSWKVPIEKADFVFVDGDHRWPALADTLRAVTWGAKVICMHDTQSYPKLKDCWGSFLAARMLRQSGEWDCTEDSVEREGEKTFRGFLIARRKGGKA